MWDKTVLKFQSFAAAFWRLCKCLMTNLLCTCFPPSATAALTPWDYQSHVKVHAIYYEALPDLKCTLNVMSQTCSDEPQQFSASCCLQFSIFSDCLPLFFFNPLHCFPPFFKSHLSFFSRLCLSGATGNLLVNPLEPANADKLLVKIADLGNACWVVSANIHSDFIQAVL